MCKTLWLVHGEEHGHGHEGVFGPHRLFYKCLLQRCAHKLNFYKIEERPDNMVVVLVAVWCLWLAVTWCLVCRRMTSLITTGNLD